MKKLPIEIITLTTIVGGGQTLGMLASGKKIFVWGGVEGEKVEVQVTKQRSSHAEGIVLRVLEPSPRRVAPPDPDSYLSTSPWQIYDFTSEQDYKARLIKEAFDLHKVALPAETSVKTDRIIYGYRNKVEFSFWYDIENERLDLAFFKRGSHGKVAVQGTSLARPEITAAAQSILSILRASNISGRDLKTLLLRSTQKGEVAAQLYVKERGVSDAIDMAAVERLGLLHFEVIYSNPKSPASIISERLVSIGSADLTDTILGIPFRYACESFFQVNVPVYEMALRDMKKYVPTGAPVIDLYSGVGTIGLTIGGESPTLVEINEPAVEEMKRNIKALHSKATAVLASSESALEYLTAESCVIVDPPRAGLHDDLIDRLLDVAPPRIIYLSCNPVTQARDVSKLLAVYTIRESIGYNFFPRTPHIEHLVVLDKKV